MLQVNGLNKRFGGLVAVSDVSFNVKPGEIMGLIGPNGAGKTTCLNLITGFYRPTSGGVSFDGVDVTRAKPNRMAALGVVRTFQKTNVFSKLTVFENVLTAGHRTGVRSLWGTFFPRAKERESERRLRENALGIIAEIGLGARIDTEASALSCGELRLLEIGVALAAQPRLLILDEPAAGLNSHEAELLGKLLVGLIGARVDALLLVEHNMNLVMSVSSRIVVMHFGEKLAEGNPDEIREDPKVIEAYLGKADT